jgi:hypothetical protein
VALQFNQLPAAVRALSYSARTGFTELRTRIETGATELVLVPADGSEVTFGEERQIRANGDVELALG